MILDKIVAQKRIEVAERKASQPLAELQKQATEALTARDFAAALAQPGVSLIGELKKASPSKGLLRADFAPIELAAVYAANGARAMSILTDEPFFHGRLAYLKAVREAEADGSLAELPLLRKDFMIDPYQVWEARAWGADAILLIVAILDDAELTALRELAESLGMTALVEVHDAAEARRAVASGARVVGVNNRDLRDFSVDIHTTLRLRPLVPADTILVAESGIHTAGDVAMLEQGGVDAILVGEALMTAPDMAAKVRELSGVGLVSPSPHVGDGGAALGVSP
ncbi:MAG: indole-3-glycerol phosphate synthase TrpC [Anaerolineae bacterium]